MQSPPRAPRLPVPPPQACAPLYSWRPIKDEGGRDPVGTCFLSIGNFSKFVEYAPCRSGGTPPMEPPHGAPPPIGPPPSMGPPLRP